MINPFFYFNENLYPVKVEGTSATVMHTYTLHTYCVYIYIYMNMMDQC